MPAHVPSYGGGDVTVPTMAEFMEIKAAVVLLLAHVKPEPLPEAVPVEMTGETNEDGTNKVPEPEGEGLREADPAPESSAA